MTKPILVGYDPRTCDYAPIWFGATMARFTGAPLLVAAVERSGEDVDPGGHVDEDLMTDCTAALAEVEDQLRAHHIKADCVRLQSTSAARALHEAAEREAAGLLVVGSPRRASVGRLLLGSTAERLLHGAPCPVAVVPRVAGDPPPPNTVGVAWVDTQEGADALRGAHVLAQRFGATLRAIAVLKERASYGLETETMVAGQLGKDLEDVEGEHLAELRDRLQQAIAALEPGDVPIEIDVAVGDPAEIIVDISRHLDLLVCGSRGYGPLRAVLLGSVSRRVVSEAHCPVIVLPRGVKASLEELMAETPAPVAA